MTGKLLLKIAERFPLHLQDPQEVRHMRVSGMAFSIRSFRVKGLGHVSSMEARGFFGLMKMDTLIITPTQVDMPLFSYDRVNAMGNDTLIFELYDTLLGETDLSALERVKEAYRALPDHDLGAHWYDSIKLPQSLSKKGKRLHTAAFNAAAEAYLQAWLDCAQAAVPCEPEAKREKASVYVEGLLLHGGPSTDVFKKSIGEEKTAQLFRTVLFGTKS